MKLIIGLLLLISIASSESVEKLIVTSGGSKPTIAFLPFTNNSGVKIPKEYLPETIISSDLTLSGRFKTIKSNDIDTAYWNVENVVAYVNGIYSKDSDGNLVIECRLTDFATYELMYGNVYTLAHKDIRKNMHHFSDHTVKAFYNTLGVASTKIAYVSKSKGKKEILVTDYDGYNKKRVVSDGSINTMPEWGKDNRSLYYVSFKEYHGKIFKKNILSGRVTDVIPKIEQSFVPRVSSDFKSLLFTKAYQGNSDVYRLDFETKKVTQLSKHWAIETSGAWSPDGSRIVYSSDRGGMPQLYSANRDGGDIKRLTFEGKYNDSPQWSPNGKKIVFCGMSKKGRFNIYVIDVATKEVQQLTNDEGNNEGPVWSPDGKVIAFSSTRLGTSQIYIMGSDGTGLTQITKKGQNSSPAWSHYNNHK